MNKTKLPSLISILIFTLITVVAWVSLEIFIALTKSAESIVPAEISQPLTPSLDQNSIDKIGSRTFLDNSQIPDNIVSSSPVPAVKGTPGPIATPKIEPTIQPLTASGSGSLP